MMSDEAKKARNDYQKAWRQKNSAKMKQYETEYWERKAKKDKPELWRGLVEVPLCEVVESPYNDENILEQRIIELDKKGLSLREIALRFDISHMKVSRILKGCNKVQQNCNTSVT